MLEEAPPAPAPAPARPWQLLTLSAKTPAALEAATDALAARLPGLASGGSGDLADAAHTLRVGRRSFGHRRIVVCREAGEAARWLAARDGRRVQTRFCESKNPPVVFLFPGQGAQYVNMGRALYEAGGEFAHWLDRCCDELRPSLGRDLRQILYPAEGGAAEAGAELQQTQFTQPALFAVEYALARVWMSWGVRPWAMVGHSVGEWVAACLAGVFTLEAALALVAERGRLMAAQPAGAMVGVGLGEAELTPLLGEGLWLAAVNGPERCVAAGGAAEVARLEATLRAMGTPGRRLETSHAFHSGLMEGAVEPLTAAVRAVGAAEPQMAYISNVTGRWASGEEACEAGYWGRQLRQTVRFAAGLDEALGGGERVVIEVGPGRGLTGLARRRQVETGREAAVYAAMRGGGEAVSDEEVLLGALGGAWMSGVGVGWHEVGGAGRRRVSLPGYPFERRRYWVEAGAAAATATATTATTVTAEVGGARAVAVVRPPVAEWFYLPTWRRGLWPTTGEAVGGDGGGGGAWEAGRWLVFGRGGGELTGAVMEELGRRGGVAELVEAGGGAGRSEAGGYVVRAGERADYEWLIGEVVGRLGSGGGSGGLGVIHLWGVEGEACDPACTRRRRRRQQRQQGRRGRAATRSGKAVRSTASTVCWGWRRGSGGRT